MSYTSLRLPHRWTSPAPQRRNRPTDSSDSVLPDPPFAGVEEALQLFLL